MLAIAIESDDTLRALSTRFGKCKPKAVRLALVQRLPEQCNWQSVQLLSRGVRRTVIDDHHPRTQRQCHLRQRTDGRGLVVCWNDNPDTVPSILSVVTLGLLHASTARH